MALLQAAAATNTCADTTPSRRTNRAPHSSIIAPLAPALRAVRARARRVLWLNPLAGDARYEPTARAMAAALPYVDRLLPAHDLASLERLLPLLAA